MKNITAPMSYLTKSVFLSTITIITAIKKRWTISPLLMYILIRGGKS
jgi:hypothetical protein